MQYYIYTISTFYAAWFSAQLMPLIRGCSALVIRCFKRVEQFADWLTGAAGPVFVFLCWTLILSGGIAFCQSFLLKSSLEHPPNNEKVDVVARDISLSWTILLSPIFVLVPLNLYGQYFLVTHVPPGFPSPRAIQKSPVKPLSTEREARWILSNPNSLWSPDRYGLGIGRQAKSAGFDEIRATGKRVRKCRKCDGPKPEVSCRWLCDRLSDKLSCTEDTSLLGM